MEIELISGRFTAAEAEQLVTQILKVKIAFHEQKIRTTHESEEDLKHSERRIKQLEEHIRNVIKKTRSGEKEKIDINVQIKIN